jgi:hypothetical protein
VALELAFQDKATCKVPAVADKPVGTAGTAGFGVPDTWVEFALSPDAFTADTT